MNSLSSRGKKEGGGGCLLRDKRDKILFSKYKPDDVALLKLLSKPQPVNDGFSHVDQVIMTIMTVNDSSNKGINPKVIQELLVGGGHPILIIDKHHK